MQVRAGIAEDPSNLGLVLKGSKAAGFVMGVKLIARIHFIREIRGVLFFQLPNYQTEVWRLRKVSQTRWRDMAGRRGI